MNSRILSLALILSSSPYFAEASYGKPRQNYTTYTTHTTFSNQPQQRLYANIEALAADPNLAYNQYLQQQFMNYANNCYSSDERQSIFFSLAQNPSLLHSPTLTAYLSNYINDCYSSSRKKEIIDLLMQRRDIVGSYQLEEVIARSIEQSFGSNRHALILKVAQSPYLVQSNRLFAQVQTYLDQCWSNSDKSELLRTLASNPNVYNNYTCSQTVHTHVYQQQDPDAAAALFAGAAVGFAAGTVLYNLFFDEPTTYTTTCPRR